MSQRVVTPCLPLPLSSILGKVGGLSLLALLSPFPSEITRPLLLLTLPLPWPLALATKGRVRGLSLISLLLPFPSETTRHLSLLTLSLPWLLALATKGRARGLTPLALPSPWKGPRVGYHSPLSLSLGKGGGCHFSKSSPFSLGRTRRLSLLTVHFPFLLADLAWF